MNNKINELIKAFNKITDVKEVYSKLDIATTIREEVQKVIKEISKKL